MNETINHIYGNCALNNKKQACLCLKNGWMGKACPNWIPVDDLLNEKVESMEDLLKYAKKLKELNNEA
jgi:hypothetical protein